jgi:hypothetical protein
VRLDRLPDVGHFERSRDERLAERITAHFALGEPFPSNEAGLSIEGFDAMPPTVYGFAWQLEAFETWHAHQLGTIFHGVNDQGEFRSAGSAAILVTNRYVRLMLGQGGPGKPSGTFLKTRGDTHAEGTKLERNAYRYIELTSLGAGDLLVLEHWKVGKLHLRFPWSRSLGAMIAGFKATAQNHKAIENSVVNLRETKRLEVGKSVPVLEVKRKD